MKLFNAVTLPIFHIVYKTKWAVKTASDWFIRRFVCLDEFCFRAENRRHGTLTPGPKASAKKQPWKYLLHSNPKIAYFSESIGEQWSHSSCTKKKQLNLLYREITENLKQEECWRSQCKILKFQMHTPTLQKFIELSLHTNVYPLIFIFVSDCHLAGNSNVQNKKLKVWSIFLVAKMKCRLSLGPCTDYRRGYWRHRRAARWAQSVTCAGLDPNRLHI